MGLIDISKLGLTPALSRDLSMVLPFLESGDWFTSISIAKSMYSDGSYYRKEIIKVSTILSNIFHKTNLLERHEKRKIYFHGKHKKHNSLWAYRLKPGIIKEYE